MRHLSKAVACAALTGFGLVPAAQAGVISYGDFAGNTVDFLGVTENPFTDPGPLFGQPLVSGDGLLFNQMSFSSFSSGGGSDLTSGQIDFTIAARDGQVIPMLAFDEAGSYTLTGTGEAGAAVSATYFINILEVDGSPITPVSINFEMPIGPSGGDWTLADDGIGSDLWEGFATVDLDAVLAAEMIDGRATRVSVTGTNTLSTFSSADSSALISKKDMGGVVITVVPTPGAIALLGMAGLIGRRRRR